MSDVYKLFPIKPEGVKVVRGKVVFDPVAFIKERVAYCKKHNKQYSVQYEELVEYIRAKTVVMEDLRMEKHGPNYFLFQYVDKFRKPNVLTEGTLKKVQTLYNRLKQNL